MLHYRFSAFWLRSKCSICSYQLNIWYGGHVPPSILNWFLQGDKVQELAPALSRVGLALQYRQDRPTSPLNHRKGIVCMSNFTISYKSSIHFCLDLVCEVQFTTTRRFGRPTAALLLAPAEGWGPCWGPSAPSPSSPPKKSKKKKIQDGRHGPKMAASNRYGSN